MAFKSGFIALIGRPNAGKSTLVNALVRQKVAIVSSKPQTTRNRVLGIVNRPAAETSGKSNAQGVDLNKAGKTDGDSAEASENTNTEKTNVQDGAQVVLIDTPGLHHGTGALSRLMIDETRQAVEGVDILALIVDASTEFGAQDREALGWVRRFRGPVFLLLNKVDRMKKEILLPLIDFYQKEFNFAEIFPISALKGQQLGALMDSWISYLPENEPYFSTDDFTDQPERFMAAEFIREKAIAFTREEVPHSVAVLVEDFEESDTLVRIRANIYVERDGQKQILIGKGGEMVKKIGTEARKELEKLLGVKIFLELFVKVEPNWRQRSNLIRQLDWRRQMEGMVPEDSMPIQSEAGRAADAEDESEFEDIDEGESKEQEKAEETAEKNDSNNNDASDE